MKIKILIITIFFSFSSYANEKAYIFTCEPEWKALADEIGGKNIESFSATNDKQDPHHIRAKPSLIAKIGKADLLICTGADLEIGWLPLLLEKGSREIQIGKIGNLMTTDFVETIEKPETIDRSDGDVHPHGNPHIHLDPYNILTIAGEINKRLKIIDPENAKNYQNNHDNFVRKWKKSIKILENKARKLKNIKIISHHKSFSYLFKWLNINEIATLEPKPGINPTPKYLKKILELVRNNNDIKYIIRAPHDRENASNWLAKKSNIKELALPFTNGKNNANLFILFDNIILKLLRNL